MIQQTTLITGASSGIGLEMALIFAKKGNNIVLTARNHTKLKELQMQIKQNFKVNVWVFPIDLSHQSAAKELYDEIKKNKIAITQLVNNAGFGDYGNFYKLSIEKANAMMQLNMISLVNLTYYFVKDMKDNNYGKILNTASILSFFPMPRFSVYAATKSFVLSFSEALSRELKKTNISVTCLCPGPTKSNFTQHSEMNKSFAYNKLKQAVAKDVAKYGIRAMEKGKRTAIYGLKNKIIVFLTRLGTRSFVLKIANFISSK